jgi:hypothetical protein
MGVGAFIGKAILPKPRAGKPSNIATRAFSRCANVRQKRPEFAKHWQSAVRHVAFRSSATRGFGAARGLGFANAWQKSRDFAKVWQNFPGA